MVLGWRRAFCTSIPRDRERETTRVKDHKHEDSVTPAPRSRLSSKFNFFSNPSTPRSRLHAQAQAQPVPGSALRCRTSCDTLPDTAATVPSMTTIAVPPESPKLQCKIRNSPRFFQRSNPSSPRSPSAFSLLKSSLLFSKTRCGICLLTIKTGQGTAIFTAECSHSFHFPCIAAHVKKEGNLICPDCHSTWKEMPVLSVYDYQTPPPAEERIIELTPKSPISTIKSPKFDAKDQGRAVLKVYNDDEPLASPTSGARFNPIPESDENDDEGSESAFGEFQGFIVHPSISPVMEKAANSRNVEIKLLPEAAVISAGRSYETYAIVLKLRAPQVPAKTANRAPIDLVTVLDVSGKMTAENIQVMKRAMRLVISSLSASDRLSIIAFSSTSKRLLPLRRMTTTGRRSARRIIDAVISLDGTAASASDALKKAIKVLEDRREKNAVASILLLSDRHDDRCCSGNQRRQLSIVTSVCTRFTHFDFPVHSIDLNNIGDSGYAPFEDAIAKSVGGLLNVVVQDLRIQLGVLSDSAEIAAVYSYSGRPAALGSGSVRIGDLYAEEERGLLIELKVPSLVNGAHYVLSARCSYRDPTSQDLVHCKEQALLVPRPHAARSSTPSVERLRNLFIATRAMAESRRLVERNNLTGAHHVLSSARALLLQMRSASADEFVSSLEADLLELYWKRQTRVQEQMHRRKRNVEREEVKSEPVTPTSAWRAAERLAKVAITRKSMNRVSDLHGFENARF